MGRGATRQPGPKPLQATAGPWLLRHSTQLRTTPRAKGATTPTMAVAVAGKSIFMAPA